MFKLFVNLATLTLVITKDIHNEFSHNPSYTLVHEDTRKKLLMFIDQWYEDNLVADDQRELIED